MNACAGDERSKDEDSACMPCGWAYLNRWWSPLLTSSDTHRPNHLPTHHSPPPTDSEPAWAPDQHEYTGLWVTVFLSCVTFVCSILLPPTHLPSFCLSAAAACAGPIVLYPGMRLQGWETAHLCMRYSGRWRAVKELSLHQIFGA